MAIEILGRLRFEDPSVSNFTVAHQARKFIAPCSLDSLVLEMWRDTLD
jgi:hypothetical protein